jgi:hypothetical protein
VRIDIADDVAEEAGVGFGFGGSSCRPALSFPCRCVRRQEDYLDGKKPWRPRIR